jgi:hypothetical protein
MRSSTDNRTMIQSATNATYIEHTSTLTETTSAVENGIPIQNEHHTRTNEPTSDNNPSITLYHTREAKIKLEHLLIGTMTVIKTNLLNYSHSCNPSCGRTYAQTNPSAQRATQLRSVLARVYTVSRQNLNTTTVP